MSFCKDFGTVITAMVTPFLSDTDQTVDIDGVGHLANFLLRNGSDSLLLTGSTGEAPQLSEEERCEIIKHIRQSTPKGTRLIVSTGDTNTKRAIAKTLKAFELGADGVLISVPEYIKPPQESIRIHFNAIAKAVPDKPIIIYNIPGRTGTEILPHTVAVLAQENRNIIGIKQSMPNLDRVSELRISCPSDFQIYSGDDSLTLPMLALGAKGVISVASHIAGRMIKKMIDVFPTDPTQSMQYHKILYPLYKTLSVTTNPIPIKEALYQYHLIASPELRTLRRVNSTEEGEIYQTIRKFQFNEQVIEKMYGERMALLR